MSTLDADILATLTPEEQEAIRGDGDDPIPVSASADDGADDQDDEPDDGDADYDEGGSAAPIEGKQEKPEPQPQAEQPSSQYAEPVPIYKAEAPSDIAERLKALDEAEDAIQGKFDDGELDASEVRSQRAEIRQQRDELVAARIKAEVSQEMHQQAIQEQWAGLVRKFMDSVKDTVNYYEDAKKAAYFDAAIKDLANDEDNASRSAEWFLSKAHQITLAKYDIAAPASSASAAKPAAKEAAKPSRHQSPLADVPKSLAHVPGGDGPGDVSGEFDDILKLDGYALEDALSRMTPAQRERFARA